MRASPFYYNLCAQGNNSDYEIERQTWQIHHCWTKKHLQVGDYKRWGAVAKTEERIVRRTFGMVPLFTFSNVKRKGPGTDNTQGN